MRDAAEVLLAWPAEKRGGAWWTACKAAHGALSGTLDPETARKAFLKAARVAGVLVREGMPALSSIPFKQVIVQTDEIEPLRAVASVREAAEMLASDGRPRTAAETYEIACIVCRRALAGDVAAEAARRAFIAAVKEAGIFVHDGDGGGEGKGTSRPRVACAPERGG